MARYLTELGGRMRDRGYRCPFLLMTSGGGLPTLETAIRFPIRLVQSGPAGGAILATESAKDCGLANVVCYDMGGPTAKIYLIADYATLSARTFSTAVHTAGFPTLMRHSYAVFCLKKK